MSSMKIALVHDYLREYGGAERVLEALHELFPEAPVYVAFFDANALGDYAHRFQGWDIRETKLTELPLYKKLFSPYRVFAAWAFEQLDLSEYDLVISSTNAYQSKAVRVSTGAKHLSYVHTPSRALYGFSTKTNWKKNPVIRVAGEVMNFWMRWVDFRTAQRPDVLIANSTTTQQRIRKFWRRDSVIIPPPVALVDSTDAGVSDSVSKTSSQDRSYLLFVGRLVLSKHPEKAVQVSNELGLPLKVVGTGAMLEALQKQAGPQVEFLGAVDDTQLAHLYRHAKLVLFPAEDEDFGLVPIEAQSQGTPVVAHFSGEPRFTVQPGKTGEHVRSFELDDWKQQTKKAWDARWSSATISKSVQKYSYAAFSRAIKRLIEKTV